jgi:hypothetical protein
MKTTYYANALLTEERGTNFGHPAITYWAVLKCSKGPRSTLNSTALALNDTVCLIPTGGSVMKLYKVTTAGTTAASQGSLYPGAANEAITDGTAVLTEQTTALQAGTVSEPTIGTNAYARAAIASNTTNWAAASAGSIANLGTAWAWPQATPGAWTSGTEYVWGVAEYDAASAGNALNILGLQSGVQISALATFSIAASSLTRTEA